MDEYISREELRKHLKECYDDELFDADIKKAVIGIDIYVENMPSADVQPVKHGIWLDNPNQSQLYSYICSNCRNSCDWTYRYCPNCGSKNRMDGDSDA